MFFNLYNGTAGWQLLGWVLVFCGLVLLNEFARQSKIGGIICFIGIPGALTIYFVVVNICAHCGVAWAANNPTYTNMNSWFHYAKLYAATIGCVGFMMIKYGWGIGKQKWFKVYPFSIVAINILIAVASDFESVIKGGLNGGYWLSSEGVWVYGGWWNLVNGIAGIINILCMTGWFSVYASKNKKDMIWADMTWVYIVAYDIWNFCYTYNNLPTHAWYCGLALLLAPTFANAFWNKGGWIQNRANTLALWCMFAQVVPMFQDNSVFTVLPSLYGSSYTTADLVAKTQPTEANPQMMAVLCVIALVVNVLALTAIVVRSIKAKKNPYTNDIFTDQKDYQEAMAKVEQIELPAK